MSEQLAPRVKICGITRLQDAELAAELGAWAVGMIFYERSPRACSMDEALRIATALRRKLEVCGVFVNATLDDVVRTGEELGLTMLQLHGDEGPAYCAEAGHRTGARVIKAAQVSTIGEVRDVERFHTDFHLLDARASEPGREGLRGGTGETFDWSLLSARRSKVPLILSGGLGPDNAVAAIRAAAEQGIARNRSHWTPPAARRPPRAQGPRAYARVLRCGARLLDGGHRAGGRIGAGNLARVSAIEHRFGRYGGSTSPRR